MGRLWASWRRLGGVSGPSWAVLGPSQDVLGRFRGALGRLGPFLVPSWGCLGASWGRLGAILGRLGALLGVSWGVLGASWGLLAAKTQQEQGIPEFWCPLGAVLASFLEGFWMIFGMKFQYFSYLILKYLNMS